MARVVNNYKPTIRLHDGDSDLWGPHPDYDVNWVFPLQPLENAVVQLTPFIPRLHAETFWEQFQPESAPLTRYFPLTLLDLEAFLTFVESEFRRKYDGVLFAIVDKTQPHDSGLSGALAGIIGLLRTVPTQLTTEIGGVITLPRFQRTHVTSNAIGLLLQYCLNLPSAAQPGLGMRRVVWHSHTENTASINAALRMGFRQEGIARWLRIVPEGYPGRPPRTGDPAPGNGVDLVVMSICWDDWEDGVCEIVQRAMNRRA